MTLLEKTLFSHPKHHNYPHTTKRTPKHIAGRSVIVWGTFLCCVLFYMRNQSGRILFPHNSPDDQQEIPLAATTTATSSHPANNQSQADFKAKSSKLQGMLNRFDAVVDKTIEKYNAMPSNERYKLTSKCSPDLRACSCYAEWFERPEEEVCQEMIDAAKADAGLLPKPELKIAIPKGWLTNIFLRKDNAEKSVVFDCPASFCHIAYPPTFEEFDSTGYDGMLGFFGCDLGSNPKPRYPESNPWFRKAFVMQEPSSLTVDYIKRPDHDGDVAMTYVQPIGMPDDEYIHTTLAEHPAKYFSQFNPPAWTDRKFAVSAMTGKCYGERVNLVNDVSSKANVMNFGACGRNTDVAEVLPECVHENWRHEQRCIASHFKFHLAFENSRYKGYVTEKLWNMLVMGTIPIYWGAPDVDDFLPDKEAIIRVSDFESIDALVDYIKLLLDSPIAYEKHMAWRSKPLPQRFIDNMSKESISAAPCQFCDYIAKLREKMLSESKDQPYI